MWKHKHTRSTLKQNMTYEKGHTHTKDTDTHSPTKRSETIRERMRECERERARERPSEWSAGGEDGGGTWTLREIE